MKAPVPSVRPALWDRWPTWLKIAGPITLVALVVVVATLAPSSSSDAADGDASTNAAPETTDAPSTTLSVPRSTTSSPATTSAPPTSSTVPLATDVPPILDDTSLVVLLASLAVEPEGDAGYDRDLFGYLDGTDAAGCNTRNRVLMDESLTPAQVDAFGCGVVEGDWYSLYDDQRFTSPGDVEIDHVVALKEAWDSGASSWSSERLHAFANDVDDPVTLRAVSASSNQSKSDKDPAEWLPPFGPAVCPYVADWLVIKVRWGLSVDTREHDALSLLVAGCLAPAPPATTEPSTLPPFSGGGSSGGSESAYYANCSAAEAAGVAPLYIGEPGYRPSLDRDKDGVACEQ